MKILNLRFRNLNSLYGEWFIDFTVDDYQKEGVFAILGDTGAGKTTILDAICLALYRKTPRLNIISESSNEIMSKGMNECSAEVEFQCANGIFRCKFSQKRTKQNSKKPFRVPHHEIVFAKSGEIISSVLKDIPQIVEDKTGLDYLRFSRSCMLAQGSFDAFLNANEKEKSDILERITGTEIYSAISMRVYDRNKNESNKLKNLKESLHEISLMTDEEEEKSKKEVDFYKKSLSEIDIKLRFFDSQLDSLNRIKKTQKDLEETETKIHEVDQETDDFEKDKIKLENDSKIRDLESSWISINDKKQNINNNNQIIKDNNIEKKRLEPIIVKYKENYKKFEKEVSCLKENFISLEKICNEIKKIDSSILILDENLNQKKAKIKSINLKIKEDEANKRKYLEEQNSLNILKNNIKNYKEEHSLEKELLEIYDSLKIKISKVVSLKKERTVLITSKKEINGIIGDSTKKIEVQKEEKERNDTEIRKTEENYKKFISQYNLELGEDSLKNLKEQKELLHKNEILLAKVESLEEERKVLKDGDPCPLCGALNHPLKDKDVIQDRKITNNSLLIINNKIDKLESLNEQKEEINKIFNSLKIKDSEIENKLNLLCLDVTNNKEKITDIDIRINSNKKEEEEFYSSMKSYFDYYMIKDDNYDELLKSAYDGKESYKTALEKEKETINRLSVIETSIKNCGEFISRGEKEQTQFNIEITENEKNLDEEKKIRIHLFGNKDPDEEIKNAKKQIQIEELNLSNCNRELDELLKKIDEIEIQNKVYFSSIEKLNLVLIEEEKYFYEALKERGITDSNLFASMLLPSDLRTKLSNKQKELEITKIDLKSRLKILRKAYDDEKSKVKENYSFDYLEEEKQKTIKQQEEIKEKESSINQELNKNFLEKKRYANNIKQISTQEEISRKWAKLCSLIGSAEGKTFRLIAQSITFNNLIKYSNEQLKNMTDRYILIQDQQSSLSLNVIDLFQNSRVRTVKNLSGGETFLVSLSLALGLSSMSSRNVEVNSLFLDEGFGTLKGDVLEKAIDTLCGLNRQGKIIGIISHVERLRERIRVKIEVEKTTFKGKSNINGPGCKLISKE